MNDFYVYSYSEPGSPEPFYIGKGRGNRATHGHLEGNTLVANKLRKMAREGIQFEIDYLQVDLTEQEAFDYERELIAYWGRIDLGTGCLANHTDGGDGKFGCICSEEKKLKLRLAQLGRTHECSFDHRIKMSRPRDKDVVKRIRESNVESRGRKICSINPLTGQVIRIFDSVGMAQKKYGSNIDRVLKGYSKTAGGYFWRDATENDVPLFKD